MLAQILYEELWLSGNSSNCKDFTYLLFEWIVFAILIYTSSTARFIITMSKKQKSQDVNPVIIVSVLGLIGTIITAILSSPVLVAKFQNAPVPTITVPALTPMTTSTLVANNSQSGLVILPQTGHLPSQLINILGYVDVWNYSLTSGSSNYLLELPDTINPETDPMGSLAKIIVSVQTKEITLQPRISSTLKLVLTLQNIQSKDGLDIKVEKDAIVKIFQYEKLTKSHINALIPPSSEFVIPVTGGAANFHFTPVVLDSIDRENQVLSTTITDYDSVILEPGEIGTFDLLVKCKNPGKYGITVSVEVFFAGNPYEIILTPPILNCPKSLTIWNYNSLSNVTKNYEWIKLGDYALQDGEYKSYDLQLPVDEITATP